jgi:hypothetical protein
MVGGQSDSKAVRWMTQCDSCVLFICIAVGLCNSFIIIQEP